MNKNYLLLLSSLLVSLSTNVRADDIDVTPWPMYQQNAAHTGFVSVKLNPKTFKFSWKSKVGDVASPGLNYSLSGAVTAGNLVFVSRSNYVYSNTLQAFSSKNGHEVWRKNYNEVMVNPPSLYKNKVFVQTVNNASPDTALYAYNAISGKILFKSPTSAQWESYLAPTVFNDHVYAAGGTYGGMYSFQAKSGDRDWFQSLGQYDDWTPAVNDQYAIAYTGGQLNVLDRKTGNLITNINDLNYEWSGYSTSFAPVLLGTDEVAGIQSSYLTLFNIKNKNVTWAKGPGFTGQPSYDGQYIYASQNDGLVAVDKNTGKIRWKWFQDNERVVGQEIVTQNLIFVCTNQKVYAISKETHEAVWSYPATGALSLGMGYLYIVEHAGNLIAISVSE